MGEVLSFKPLGSQHIDGRAQLIQLSPSPRFFDMSFALFSLVSSSIRGLTTLPPYATICHRGSMVHQTRDATHLVVMVVLLFLLRLHGTMVSQFWGSPNDQPGDARGIETDGFGSK